jgi:HK97 family phage major capsid protein
VHAYARLTLKAVDRATRTIRGVAGQPEPDRHGDIFRPLGATFTNPIPLLLHHNTRQPVGWVTFDPPTAAGITFTATLPDIPDAGELQTRVDGAWQELEAGLLWGCSFGFQPTKPPRILPTGGLEFTDTEIQETSLVTIPAQRGASVRVVKSLFGVPDMTITEQITAVQEERTAPVARLAELVTKAAGMTADETTEYERLDRQVQAIDASLLRLKRVEDLQRGAARPVTGDAPVPFRQVIIKPNVEKGAIFTRYAMALLAGNGDSMRALARAAEWRDSTPEVELILKAAVAPATTTDAAWAKPLVAINAAAEFLELLTPATILGKLSLPKVPFNTPITQELAGGSAGWVGEGKPKPLTKFNYGSLTLPMTKVANIVTFTKELARSSSPAAETVFRRRMTNVIAAFLDSQFIDPAVAPVVGVHPGSITNALVGVPATDDAAMDLATLLGHFATASIPLSSVTLIMSESNAYALAATKDRSGADAFPDMGVTGGTINGIKVVTSQTAGALVIGVAEPLILLADDGGIEIDTSEEASLQMSDAPMDPADATTVYVSLWQANLIGLRAERFIHWLRTQASAVNYLTGAAWTPAGPAVTP